LLSSLNPFPSNPPIIKIDIGTNISAIFFKGRIAADIGDY